MWIKQTDDLFDSEGYIGEEESWAWSSGAIRAVVTKDESCGETVWSLCCNQIGIEWLYLGGGDLEQSQVCEQALDTIKERIMDLYNSLFKAIL